LGNGVIDRMPLSSTAMISPASTSRIALAPTMSSAHVSEPATTAPSGVRPSTSGRHPRGSRATSIVSPISTSSEYAPSTPCSASASFHSGASADDFARRCTSTSESIVDVKIEP
jgi:hypothetical protein